MSVKETLTMSSWKRILAITLIVISVIAIVLSVVGIIGAWWGNRVLTDITLRIFAPIETGVAVISTGVDGVYNFITEGRTEVQDAEARIKTASGAVQENSPLLTAVGERINTRLAPSLGRVQTALEPVRGALTTASNAVDTLNAIPFINERAPRLEQVNQAFDRLAEVNQDVKSLDEAIASALVERKNDRVEELTQRLSEITTGVDSKLAEVQTSVGVLQDDMTALGQRLTRTKSRLLFIYDLAALLITLMMVWVIYSQVVVIRYHLATLRRTAPVPAPEPEPLPAPEETLALPEIDAEPPG